MKKSDCKIPCLPHHICHCGRIFATHDRSKVIYQHHNGKYVALCYEHILNVANRPGTWLPRLSCVMPKDFSLVNYLNEARQITMEKPIRDKKVQQTLQFIIELLDTTGLSAYVGGVSEFLNTGLVPSKFPIIPIAEIAHA